jgi:hypothetical protein
MTLYSKPGHVWQVLLKAQAFSLVTPGASTDDCVRWAEYKMRQELDELARLRQPTLPLEPAHA